MPIFPRRTRTVAILLSTSLALAACSSDDDDGDVPPPSEDASGSPAEDDPGAFSATFEPRDCGELTTPVAVSDGPLGDPSTRCGSVSVPADWSSPDGRTVDLAVYRFASTAADPAADPVVLLTGGPGQSGASVLEGVLAEERDFLRRRSELIVVDQRGTGFSEPGLFCPEAVAVAEGDGTGMEDPMLEGPMGDPVAEILDAVTEAHRVCRDRLIGEGVVFADYTTTNNALDIAAVRRALGVDEWNLFGISYGTELALTVLREDPSGVRSVVLDSVLPLEVNLLSEISYRLYWALSQISTNCSADADCAAAYEDIRAVAEAGIARLAAAPIGDFTAREYASFLQLSVADPFIPVLIELVATGDERSITEVVTEIREALASQNPTPPLAQIPPELRPAFLDADSLNAAILCAEEFPYLDERAGPDIAAEFLDSTQGVAASFSVLYDSLCPLYDVPPADPIVTRPVTSEVPALVIAGTADTLTPPAWSILAAESLSRSQYAEFPGLGHSLSGSGVACVGDIAADFLADPDAEADQGCIDELPRVDYVTDPLAKGSRSAPDVRLPTLLR